MASRPASGFRRVESLEFDGTSASLTIGQVEIPTLGFSYGDKLAPEEVRDQGSQAISALTLGTYSTNDGKIKLRSSVFRSDLLPLLEQEGFGNRPHLCIASFTHPDMGSDSDAIWCRFVGIDAASEAASKGLEVEIGIKPLQIWWGDGRHAINGLNYTEFQQQLG